jgi:hypothetical protein
MAWPSVNVLLNLPCSFLQLADTNFRRQILFQLIISLKHLLLASQSTRPSPPAPIPSQPSAPQPGMLVPNAKSLVAKAPISTPTPTPAPAATSAPGRRKRQLMGEVTLSSDDDQWVRRLMSNCLDEWRATGAGSVKSLIARDEHWVRSPTSLSYMTVILTAVGYRLIGRINSANRLRNGTLM